MSTIVIKLNEIDITDDVEFRTAKFTSLVNGQVGTAYLRLKDLAHVYEPVMGQSLTLDIDGERRFTGYAMQIGRVYAFPVDKTTAPSQTPRYFELSGVDVNILLQKRVLYYKPDPTLGPLRPPLALRCSATKSDMWAANTAVNDTVEYILENYSDLPDDGVTFEVTDFGSPNPDACRTYSASQNIDSFLLGVNRFLNGVYYISPDKVFHMHDALVVPSDYTLTDVPSGPNDIGPQNYSVLTDATKMVNDALVWGLANGWTSPVFSRYTDDVDPDPAESSITTHGRWQKSAQATVYQQATVDEIAESMVVGFGPVQTGARWDKVVVKATVFEPVFNLGDWVTCRFESFTGTQYEPFTAPSGNGVGTGVKEITLPIRSMEIDFPTPTSARYALTLIEQPDDPYSAYEFYFPPFPPLPGFRPPKWPPIPNPDICGITDTFNRPDQTDLGTSDSGLVWDDFGESGKSIQSGRARIFGTTGAQLTWGTALAPLAARWVWQTANTEPATSFSFFGDVTLDVVAALDAPAGDGEFSMRVGGGAFTRVPFDFAPNTDYNIRVEATAGGSYKGKIWKTSESEPDWMIGISAGAWTKANSFFFFTHFVDATPLIFLENLDITGIDRCMNCGITETFTRSLSVVADNDFVEFDLGVSDAGLPWTTAYVESNGSGSTGLFELLDGELHIALSHPFGGYFSAGADLPNIPGGLVTGTFGLSWRFKYDLSGDTRLLFSIYAFEDPFGTQISSIVTLDATSADIFLNSVVGGGGSLADSATAPVQGAWYRIRWERVEGDYMRIKFWPEDDPEPVGWDITQDISSLPSWPNPIGAVDTPIYQILLDEQNGAVSTGELWMDDLDIDDVNQCTPSDVLGVELTTTNDPDLLCATSGSIGSGDAGSTASQYPYAYVAGTTQVWINGIRQMLGFDYLESDPDNGMITFTTPLVLDDVVKTCATPNGPHTG